MKTVHISYPIIDTVFEETVVAIGSFDGVHLGHQKVINTARDLAVEFNIGLAVMIFDPHPLDVINPPNSPEKITPISNKLKQFERLGVNTCYIVNFTEEISALTDYEFIKQILAKMNIKSVVIGFDFHYGNQGKGTALSLKEYAKAHNLFVVTIVDAYLIDQIKVSSSRIRSHLLDGKIEKANQLLGRPYSIEGVVVKGDNRGKQIGYPTINLSFKEEYIELLNGVYVIKAYIDKDFYYGVMNVGSRPTFYNNPADITYEIHLIDFNEDAYGKLVEVDVLKYLRQEKRFENINQLIEAIKEDIHATQKFVSLLLND